MPVWPHRVSAFLKHTSEINSGLHTRCSDPPRLTEIPSETWPGQTYVLLSETQECLHYGNSPLKLSFQNTCISKLHRMPGLATQRMLDLTLRVRAF